jgi:hypothetical protein
VLAGLPVRLAVSPTNVGQSRARNLAAAQARGDVLAFWTTTAWRSGDGCGRWCPTSTIKPLIAGGRVLAARCTGPVASFEARARRSTWAATAARVAADGAVAYLPTCNLIVRRDVLQHVGGFDAAMALGRRRLRLAGASGRLAGLVSPEARHPPSRRAAGAAGPARRLRSSKRTCSAGTRTAAA